MSRIGKQAVQIPDGIKIEKQGQRLTCSGPKGVLSMELLQSVKMLEAEKAISFELTSNSRQARADWGLMRAQLANMVRGVSEGWTKELEIRGVGFRAEVQGKTLKLNLGFSHDVNYPIPEGIDIKCEKPTSILISGIDKQKIGQIAAEIRSYRKPEPYKGKGVRYVDEYVLQKEGKKK